MCCPVPGLDRGKDAGDLLRLDHGKLGRVLPVVVGQIRQHAPGHGPDARLQKDMGRRTDPSLRQLLHSFPRQGGVALDDPARHVLIARPAGVLDQQPPLFLRLLRGIPHSIVIGQRQDGGLDCAHI